jgi:hypothetical protein
MVWKNFPIRHLVVLPFYSLWRYFEQVRTVMTGTGTGREFRVSTTRGEIIKALLKGIRDGLGGIVRMFHKRRQLKKIRRLTMHQFSQLLRRYRITFRELLDHD